MENKVVSLNNVIFELYKSALAGEITQSEFLRAKSIVKRAKTLNVSAQKNPHTAQIEQDVKL